jgi:RNA polymerase sigma factor (sigma-70 family)
MRRGSTRQVQRQLQTLFHCGVMGQLSDEELLELFIALGDDTADQAFAALLRRHGPMVYAVCRRLLGDAHDAEDAFQATFLVLARKANSVVRREKVASWLYGVAYRTANELRVRDARRRAREAQVGRPPWIDRTDALFQDELRAILDEELARLPARDRGPLVLCELEGVSREEAARQLGVPEGTLSSRLARAKARLRARLARRGLVLPIAGLALALSRDASAVAVPEVLIDLTTRAALRVAAGFSACAVVSTAVVSLTEGVLKVLLLAKLKGIACAVGTTAIVVSSAVVLAQAPGPQLPGAGTPTEADRAAVMERKLDRIISVLDRMTGDLSTSSEVIPKVPPPAPATTPASEARSGPSLAPVTTKSQRWVYQTTLSVPLADRVAAVENTLTTVQDRLTNLERRLGALDKRVGPSAGPTAASFGSAAPQAK